MANITCPAPTQLANSTEPSPDGPSQPSFPKCVSGMHHVQESKHPRAFYRLCLAVLCERWAAFMLTSTAALMLCARFGLPKASALRMLGIASAANYFGSLPGGYLLDRITDPHRGLSISSLLLLLGYTTLSLPYRPALYLAFTLLFFGQSLFKPSTQRILLAHFPTEMHPLEGAQVLLHMAVNLGAAVGCLLAGVLADHAGWSVTYASAALVMGVSGALLWPSQPMRRESNHPSPNAPNQAHVATSLPAPNRTQIITGLTLTMFIFTLCTAQAEGSLLLWSQDRIDRVVLGFDVPVAWFLAFPALLVLGLAPLQFVLLSRLKRSVGAFRLVTLGLVAAALCFAVLLPTTMWTERVSMVWLAASLSFFVLSELLITPIGLALLLRSTPRRFIGLATGLWYGAGALGYLVGGQLGALWSKWPTQRVLTLLICLPLLGALLLWKTQPPSDQESTS